jgi:hypothetical protein
MKVPAAPCPHAELREVPLTSARLRNLQAPAEVGTRRMPSGAAAALLHACADHLEAGHAGHGRHGQGSPGQDCSGGGLHSRTVAQGHPDCRCDQHRSKTRLSRRQGRRECIPSLPGDEPRALCFIKVHSIHELDTQYMSSAPFASYTSAPCSVHAGVTNHYRTKL